MQASLKVELPFMQKWHKKIIKRNNRLDGVKFFLGSQA